MRAAKAKAVRLLIFLSAQLLDCSPAWIVLFLDWDNLFLSSSWVILSVLGQKVSVISFLRARFIVPFLPPWNPLLLHSCGLRLGPLFRYLTFNPYHLRFCLSAQLCFNTHWKVLTNSTRCRHRLHLGFQSAWQVVRMDNFIYILF